MTQEIKELPVIFLGLFFITVGLNWFLLPRDITSTGVDAIGYLVETVFSVQRSVTIWSISPMMLLLAAVLLGRSVFFKTVTGSLLFPIVLEIVPEVEMISSHFFSLTSGSLLFSLGIYTLYTARTSNDGITISPIIFHKFFRLSVPQGLLLTNNLTVFLNYYVFELLETLFVLLSVTISSLLMRIPICLSSASREFE